MQQVQLLKHAATRAPGCQTSLLYCFGPHSGARALKAEIGARTADSGALLKDFPAEMTIFDTNYAASTRASGLLNRDAERELLWPQSVERGCTCGGRAHPGRRRPNDVFSAPKSGAQVAKKGRFLVKKRRESARPGLEARESGGSGARTGWARWKQLRALEAAERAGSSSARCQWRAF